MSLSNIRLGYKDTSWFNANQTHVLNSGQHVYLSDGTSNFIDAYVIGDGTTQLSSLPWRGVKDTKIREEFTIPSVANSTVTLSYIPTFVWGVYFNGVFLLSTEYSIISGVLTIFSSSGGDVAIVYSHAGIVPSGPIGPLFNFSYSSSDWQNVGALTTTYNTSSIRLQGTNFPNQNNYTYFTGWDSDAEEITYSAEITFNSDGPTDYGVSLKLVSGTVGGQNLSCLIGGAAGVNQGQLQIYSGPTLLSSIVTLPLSINDTVLASVIISKNYVKFQVNNLTNMQQAYTDYTFSFDYLSTVYVIPPLKKFGVGSSGGDYLFSNLSVTTSSHAGCDLMIIGDSRMYGLFAGGTNPADRVVGLWQSNNTSKLVINSSGSGEKTSDLSSKVAEILLFQPKKVILFLGINDALASVPDATIIANIQSLRTQLLSIGCDFYLQLNTPCTAINVTSLNNACIAAFPSSEIIPVPPGWDPVLDNEDTVHPNAAAQMKIYLNQSTYVNI